MVLFDELPSTSLLDDRRRIDAERFPGFAELAGDATWFRNAYAIYDSTSRAIPAIMDGNLPDEEKLPTSADHPNSIFTLLGKSHQMNVSEEATTVCPRDLCDDSRLDESYASRLGSLSEDLGLVWLHVVSPPDIEEDLASVSDTWGEFGGDGRRHRRGRRRPEHAREPVERPPRAVRAMDRLDPRPRAGPRSTSSTSCCRTCPGSTCPRALITARAASEGIPRLSNFSFEDQDQIDQLYLRHLLQLRFTDMEVQRLIRHLKEIGIYDEALIVVAADHGVAFDLGERDRRRLTEKNLHEIAPVPLIVKRPGQRSGPRQRRLRRDDRHPADDRRGAGPAPSGGDRRRVGLLRRRRGPGPRARARARLLRLDPDGRRRVRAAQAGAARPQARPVRHRRRRRGADVPGRPAARADRPGRPTASRSYRAPSS